MGFRPCLLTSEPHLEEHLCSHQACWVGGWTQHRATPASVTWVQRTPACWDWVFPCFECVHGFGLWAASEQQPHWAQAHRTPWRGWPARGRHCSAAALGPGTAARSAGAGPPPPHTPAPGCSLRRAGTPVSRGLASPALPTTRAARAPHSLHGLMPQDCGHGPRPADPLGLRPTLP